MPLIAARTPARVQRAGRTVAAAMALVLLPVLLAACASDVGGASATEPGPIDAETASLSPSAPVEPAWGGAGAGDLSPSTVNIHPGRTFTVEDFVAAGWKKNKQYPTDTVPGATDIWYGFFDQKNIEIRFYPSHEAALAQGVESAKSEVKKPVRTGGVRYGGMLHSYQAYLVAGNTVMLCEMEVAVCQRLVENLVSP